MNKFNVINRSTRSSATLLVAIFGLTISACGTGDGSSINSPVLTRGEADGTGTDGAANADSSADQDAGSTDTSSTDTASSADTAKSDTTGNDAAKTDTTDNDAAKSDTTDTADNDTVNTDTKDNDTVNADTADNDTVNADTTDNDTVNSDTTDNDTIDQDTTDQDTTDQDTVDNDTSDNDTSDNDTNDNDTTKSDAADTDTVQEDAAPECTNDIACNPKNGPCVSHTCVAGACVAKKYADGVACTDGNKCNVGGTCQNAECVGAKTMTCNDDNPCTDDACVPSTGTCVYEKNGAGCDDGSACTANDLCDAGACKAGQAISCDDKNPCTTDACKSQADGTYKCHYSAADAACDDGDACTDKDACKAGSCAPGAKLVCNDSNPCTDDVCSATAADGKPAGCSATANTAACSDNAKCLAGVCAKGVCKPKTDAGCNDNNPCTDDKCGAKGCEFTARADKSTCADKDECKAASLCDKGHCVAGKAEDCNDGNPCTTDSCDPKNGCLWAANTGACEDGDKCTSGDVCKNGACQQGQAIDVVKVCDDGNICTKETCSAKDGCLHEPFATKCDDGNVCTAGEQCNDKQCTGGELVKCVDGNVCTIDICDPKSGACSWGQKKGDCDDGMGCTVGDHCDKGKCLPVGNKDCGDGNPCTDDSCDAKTGGCVNMPAPDGKLVPCDDGSKCTKSDACSGGKCQGTGAPVCNDANECTHDGCDPTSGNCIFKPHKQGCDNGDKCTFGDTCNNGKCITGEGMSCDDGSACTKDSCDATTGKCSFTPLTDGTACDDGKACTQGDACQKGACVPTKTECALYKQTFECNAAHGWQLDDISNHSVKWAVDQTPAIAAMTGWGCSLNFNDGVDYCDASGSYCLKPQGYATSPVIDASTATGKLRLRFATYYDTDGPPGGGSSDSDRPKVEIVDEVGHKVLRTILLDKTKDGCEGKPCQQQLRALDFNISEGLGRKFRLRVSLDAPNVYGNKGKGWFVDDVIVDTTPPDEVCDDGKDNDLDGFADCKDFDCKGSPACVEDCSDGKDNDLDDKVDCEDSDCSGELACQDKLVTDNFECGAGGWEYASSSATVKWGIDATPSQIKAFTGECTLNFNNGKNYCGNSLCSGSTNSSGGSATYAKTVAAAGYTKLTVELRSYDATESATSSFAGYDRKWVQISTDGFSGCSSTSTSGSSAACNTTGTTSYEIKKLKEEMNKWVNQKVDISKYANKNFTLRLRFATGDHQYNDLPGWFVDDLRVYGKK